MDTGAPSRHLSIQGQQVVLWTQPWPKISNYPLLIFLVHCPNYSSFASHLPDGVSAESNELSEVFSKQKASFLPTGPMTVPSISSQALHPQGAACIPFHDPKHLL